MGRATDWLARRLPTPETITRNRFLRPFARHLEQPGLWRMDRRPVAAGIALGLGVGVIIPFLHTFIAAILAIPLRANIAVAAATTLLINPLTIPPMYFAAYRIGLWELHAHAAATSPESAQRTASAAARLLHAIHQASGPTALGILTLAVVLSAAAYAITLLAWKSPQS